MPTNQVACKEQLYYPVHAGDSWEVQCRQRVALIGIVEWQNGHSLIIF